MNEGNVVDANFLFFSFLEIWIFRGILSFWRCSLFWSVECLLERSIPCWIVATW